MINWQAKRGDLVSVPDIVIFNKTRKYAIVLSVSVSGKMLEILVDSKVMYIRRELVLPILGLDGTWIQFGR